MNTPTLVRKQRRVLTPIEKEKMEDTLQAHEQDKKETAVSYPGESFIVNSDEQIQRIRKALKEGTAKDLNKHEKNELEKRVMQVLTPWLKSNMVPKSMVNLRQQVGGVSNPDFPRTAQKMARLEMSQAYQKVAEEYKNIMRTLGRPEDANLEHIRPE